ncbi:MAG: hypothetical protein LBN23_05265 [Paludibacter sp.]|jgi:hypothetical protein|nr:hypothetical protein [Paludibacter sp.]
MAHFIENLSNFLFDNVKYIALRDDYIFKPFDCGNSDLNEFLLNDSKIYLRHLRYTTTVLETESQTVAYYSLANDLLVIRDIEDFTEELENDSDTKIEADFWEFFFSQRTFPAVKLGRLAVDSDFQCN